MTVGEIASIIVTVAGFGLMNLGALIFMLATFKVELRELNRRTAQNEKDINYLMRGETA